MPVAEATATDTARLYRAVSMIADALERRRQKIAAGLPVESPPRCGCHRCDGTERRAS